MHPTLSLFGSIVIPNVAHSVKRNPINRQRKAALMKMKIHVVTTNRSIVQSINDDDDDDDDDGDDDCDCDFHYDYCDYCDYDYDCDCDALSSNNAFAF